MTLAPDRRPRAFPPPAFPPRKPRLFARTPPAVFGVLLGLIGLALALRHGLARFDLAAALVETLMGALVVGWTFALLALAVKIARRPGVLVEDMRVLLGRIGLAAGSISIFAMATVILPYAPDLALVLVWAGLALHAALALLMIRVLSLMPPKARSLDPGWHLSFVGFILAGVPLAQLGQSGLAAGLLWAMMPVAALIWGLSLAQLIRRIPPAPLRPLLAIHLAPAALFTTVAALTDHWLLAQAFAGFGGVILLILIAAGRWITSAGFSPLWGAFTFPLAAFATALLVLGGAWGMAGNVVLGCTFLIIPPIAWQVLRLWPGGRLAQQTNAAEA